MATNETNEWLYVRQSAPSDTFGTYTGRSMHDSQPMHYEHGAHDMPNMGMASYVPQGYSMGSTVGEGSMRTGSETEPNPYLRQSLAYEYNNVDDAQRMHMGGGVWNAANDPWSHGVGSQFG